MSSIGQFQGWPRSLDGGRFEDHKAILEAIHRLSGGGHVLDLGCGEAHVTQHMEATLVDLVPRLNPRRPVIPMDMRQFPVLFPDRRFDLMVMTDSIEHLVEQDAHVLIDSLSGQCRAMAIFTPVGPYHLDVSSKHPDDHKSAWYPEQFFAENWEIWEFPTYHRFEGGQILGAFWAWKFIEGGTPSAEGVAVAAGLSL